jgi:hypothetical protein
MLVTIVSLEVTWEEELRSRPVNRKNKTSIFFMAYCFLKHFYAVVDVIANN